MNATVVGSLEHFSFVINILARLSFPIWAGILTRLRAGQVAPSETNEPSAPLAIILLSAIVLSPQTEIALMSHSRATTSGSSSSNFQLVINNALKAYEKRTKRDLLAHPLASQLQACNSPGDILTVLQQQIQEIDQSRTGDERWTKWLNPMVNVLFTFSATLGSGVGLVCSWACVYLKLVFLFIWQVFSPANVAFAGIGVLLSVCILYKLVCDIVTQIFLRQPKMLGQAKTLSWTSSSALKCFFGASRCTQKCL